MSSVILYIAVSVDGYVARQDGSISWLDAFQSAGEDYDYPELLQRIGTVIMGGHTYRQVLGFGEWPYRGLATYVITHRSLSAPPGAGISAYSGDLKRLVTRVKNESGKDIWLVGGSQLIRSFAEEDLIDEYIIFVMPLLLGSGLPLFEPVDGPQRDIRLVSTECYPNGVVQLRYRSMNEESESRP